MRLPVGQGYCNAGLIKHSDELEGKSPRSHHVKRADLS